MSEPKFQIGEEVIYFHPEDPEHNHEFVVREITYGSFSHHYTGEYAEGYGYRIKDCDVNGWAPEIRLRKKYKPADDDFQREFKKQIGLGYEDITETVDVVIERESR